MPAFKKLRKYSRYVVSSDEAEEEQREQQPKTKLMECDSSQTQSQNEVLDLSLREKVVVREEMPTLTVEEILVRMDNEELAEEKGKEMEKEKVMEKETCVEKEREYQEGQETQEMVFTSESEAELNEAMDAFEEETKKKKEMVLQEIDVSDTEYPLPRPRTELKIPTCGLKRRILAESIKNICACEFKRRLIAECYKDCTCIQPTVNAFGDTCLFKS